QELLNHYLLLNIMLMYIQEIKLVQEQMQMYLLIYLVILEIQEVWKTRLIKLIANKYFLYFLERPLEYSSTNKNKFEAKNVNLFTNIPKKKFRFCVFFRLINLLSKQFH